jgi:hypothetical protein
LILHHEQPQQQTMADPSSSLHVFLASSLCMKQQVYPGAGQGTTRPIQQI